MKIVLKCEAKSGVEPSRSKKPGRNLGTKIGKVKRKCCRKTQEEGKEVEQPSGLSCREALPKDLARHNDRSQGNSRAEGSYSGGIRKQNRGEGVPK